MVRNPVLSPTHTDNDLLILEGVLAGVVQEGARYGLTHPRRDLLAVTLQTMLRSLREGWEVEFRTVMTTLQTGRPSHPVKGRDGDSYLSDPPHQLTS